MRKILLLISILPIFAFSAIDEYKTDVYFANGILTEEENAEINAGILEDAIIVKFGIDYYNNYIGKVDYAYNETHDFDNDITESVYQVFNMTEFIEWRDEKLGEYRESAHHANLEAQVDKYEASIKAGHKVLIVAHSQGNLFTQEAYERLGNRSADHGKWLQKYFEAVSIASPDPISDIKPDMLPRIGWDNDIVAIMGGSNNNGCSVRQVEWQLKAHLVGDTYPPKPTDNYVKSHQVDTYYRGWWKATEGWRQKYLDSNVHAFTFYMGLPLREGDENKPNYGKAYQNPFNDQNLTDGAAKILIMDQIETQLEKLEAKPSQWNPKNLGCLCKDKYA